MNQTKYQTLQIENHQNKFFVVCRYRQTQYLLIGSVHSRSSVTDLTSG